MLLVWGGVPGGGGLFKKSPSKIFDLKNKNNLNVDIDTEVSVICIDTGFLYGCGSQNKPVKDSQENMSIFKLWMFMHHTIMSNEWTF